jgi:hypothetical protein
MEGAIKLNTLGLTLKGPHFRSDPEAPRLN